MNKPQEFDLAAMVKEQLIASNRAYVAAIIAKKEADDADKRYAESHARMIDGFRKIAARRALERTFKEALNAADDLLAEFDRTEARAINAERY